MARLDWVERLLLNWARWTLCQGSGTMGFAKIDLTNPNAGRDGYVEASIPVSDVEAAETEAAVQALNPPGLALTVREVYVEPGGIKDKARRLCCSEATVHARIDQAHRQIATWMEDKRRRAQAERERVEVLQRLGARSFTE